MAQTKHKKYRMGAHLVLYGPKAAPTHARLVPRSDQYPTDPDTPEDFRRELQEERARDLSMARFWQYGRRVR